MPNSNLNKVDVDNPRVCHWNVFREVVEDKACYSSKMVNCLLLNSGLSVCLLIGATYLVSFQHDVGTIDKLQN